MSELLAAMIAAGGATCTDAREHRHLHAALVRLGKAVEGSRSLPPLSGRPDPDVGLRVEGVTGALWSLVASGVLQVREHVGGADFVVDPNRLPAARRSLMRLGEPDRSAVYSAADFWACASTARKKLASARVSAAATRVVSEANRLQSAVPARRQRAVNVTLPA